MEERFDCIYCVLHGLTPDKKGHLYMNRLKGCYHCKRCGESGAIDDGGRRKIFGLSPYNAVSSHRWDNIDLFTFSPMMLRGCPEAKKVFDYAIGRLPKEIVWAHTMQSPDLPNRWFFPVWGEDGRCGNIVMWQARDITGIEEAKYISWGKKSEYIYNLDHVEDYAVVCEGPINALSCPHGVAVFGKDLSDTQLLLLTHKYDTVYLALDYDARYWRDRMQEKLAPYVDVRIIEFEDDRDPNDLGWDYMKRRIAWN